MPASIRVIWSFTYVGISSGRNPQSATLGLKTSRKYRSPLRTASVLKALNCISENQSASRLLLNVTEYRLRSMSGFWSGWGNSVPYCASSIVGEAKGRDGREVYSAPVASHRSVVSLARTAGVTGDVSKSRFSLARTSMLDTEVSIISIFACSIRSIRSS